MLVDIVIAHAGQCSTWRGGVLVELRVSMRGMERAIVADGDGIVLWHIVVVGGGRNGNRWMHQHVLCVCGAQKAQCMAGHIGPYERYV